MHANPPVDPRSQEGGKAAVENLQKEVGEMNFVTLQFRT